MKNDIAIDTIFIIIIAIISAVAILSIIYTKFFSNSQAYYCQTLISQGGFSPSCKDYYPSAINVIYSNESIDTIYSSIVGLILNCYNNNVNTNKLFDICYDVYINKNIVLNSSTLIQYVRNYTKFNPNKIIFHLNNSEGRIYPYNSIFIIYNNSYIIIWQ